MSRSVVEEVFGKKEAKELWAIGYRPALPVTPQDYALGSVLPAVLYMMRWGHRRGKGKFFDVFGNKATISDVARKLSEDTERFTGFDGPLQQTVLADLLLAYCLENKGHRVGRDEQVQRAFPTHYFSSLIDLPKTVANLRNVPEMIVALLAGQAEGASLKPGGGDGHYQVGVDLEHNLLLSLFGSGTSIQGQQDNIRVDKFDETKEVGIDQLLTIRLAQTLGEAPTKQRGENPDIPNQLPVATRATRIFKEDFNVFLRSYGANIPRQSLLPMLESCLAIGTINIYLSTLAVLLRWAVNGSVPDKADQSPWGLFVDCSASSDATLRRLSEECVDDLILRLSRMPVCMICLRILDQRAQEEDLDGLPPAGPDPTARINFLGDLLFDRSAESQDIKRDIRKSCKKLSDAFDEKGEPHAQALLVNGDVHPAWRMADAIVYLMGEKGQGARFRQYLDSCLMLDQPNGIGRKRRTILKGKSVEKRSIVLTNTALDFLVHRHLRKAKRGTGPANLSLNEFIRILRERYGFFIDESPEGLSVPSDQLRKNRGYLERRLRDLGLFVGVNDAEAMKRLRQRFTVGEENAD